MAGAMCKLYTMPERYNFRLGMYTIVRIYVRYLNWLNPPAMFQIVLHVVRYAKCVK